MNTAAQQSGGRRVDVLAALKSAAVPLSIVQIAGDLRVHPNTVRFHLQSLLDDGLVERAEPEQRRPGRPPQLFRAVRRMNPGGARRYGVLAEILTLGLAAEPNASAKALEAGREWGRRLGQPVTRAEAPGAAESVEQLVGVLDDLGFAPQRRDTAGTIQVGLRHCPFLELAEHTSTVVCPIHLGIMQGSLETWDAPLTVERLAAFVEPDLCVAYLAPAKAGS